MEGACTDLLVNILLEAVQAQPPNSVRLALALGILEHSLTQKDQSLRKWPVHLEVTLEQHTQAFKAFVDDAHRATQALASPREKVRAVANLVWSRLACASKEIRHCQHLYTFTRILLSQEKGAKRQLDCGGVTTTVLATALELSRRPGGEGLASCCFQVAEDHCWICLDGSGSREQSVEVTTDSAARRGAAVAEAAWATWLYSGGHGVVCSTPETYAAALVTSMDPAITFSQKNGIDSKEVQRLQLALLTALRARGELGRAALYPAALDCLGDLLESLDEGGGEGKAADSNGAAAALDPEDLYREAVSVSCGHDRGAGHLWYPWSFLAGHRLQRAEEALEEGKLAEAEALLAAALKACGSCGGAAVLQRYRLTPGDEQLHKDVEGVLEGCCAGLAAHAGARPAAAAPPEQAARRLLAPLLELWDGALQLYAARGVPQGWIKALLRGLAPFSPEEREAAALTAQTSSPAMEAARDRWTALKPAALRAIFESSLIDSAEARIVKRPKR